MGFYLVRCRKSRQLIFGFDFDRLKIKDCFFCGTKVFEQRNGRNICFLNLVHGVGDHGIGDPIQTVVVNNICLM